MFVKRLFVSLFALAAVCFAQSDNARLTGSVVDSTGAAIPNATVTIRNERNGIERTVRTNSVGVYIAPNLTPSQYTIIGKAEGFSSSEYRSIVLGVGSERNFAVILSPASVQDQVNVDAGSLATLDRSSGAVGTNVSQREVGSVPINGRNLSQLYLLAAGAVTAGSGTFDNIRFNGRSNQENAIRLDGTEFSSIIDQSPGNLNGEISSGFRLQASLETVQEFRVDSSTYPAELGTGTGGQVSVVTRSGSNDFHGGVFEYLRNSFFDARNFFDRGAVTPLRLNQYGGSAGGAIKKDKIFYFLAFEGLNQRAALNIIGQVPSAAARARAVPAIKPLLAAFPLGILPTPNPDYDAAQLVGSNKLDEYNGTMRVDYRINDKLNVFLRYNRDQGESYAPYDVTGSAFYATALAQNAVLGFQQVISPNIVNDTRFGFNNPKTRTDGIAPKVPGLDLSNTTVLIGGANVLAGILSQGLNSGIATPSGLVRANSSTNGRGQPYTNYSLSFLDNLSWVRGNHSFKFGGEVRLLRLYTDRLGGVTYSYASINDFLNNNTSQVAVLGDVSAPSPWNGGVTGVRFAKTFWIVGYAQDEYRMLPTLTINYGLRYEYYNPLREEHDRQVLFDTVTGTIKNPHQDPFRSSKLNIAPRLGISWSPEKLHDKTVFRLGAGYYFGPGQVEDQIQPIESDRVNTVLPGGTPFPQNINQIIANFNINDPNARAGLRAYSPGYLLPEKVLTYSAAIAQELPDKTVLTVSYIGSQGRNLFLRSISNKIISVGTNPTTGAAIVTREFGNRFAEIDFKTSGGTDAYNGLQVSLNHRYSRGLTIAGQFTYGHSIGNSDGANEALTATNPYNYKFDRGNNISDVRLSTNINVLYELPVGRGKTYLHDTNKLVDTIVGGWEIGGIFNARSGLPMPIQITRPDVIYQDTRTGLYYANPVLVNGKPVTVALMNTIGGGASRNVRRPDVVAGVDPFLHRDSRYVVNPAAFSIPLPGTAGNLGRNALFGPSLAQFDLTLHKKFVLTERFNLEFRAEAYNILNHANFANPTVTLAQALPGAPGQAGIQPGQPFTPSLAGGTFGVSTGTVERAVGLGTSRQLQLSIRLNF